MTSKQKQLSAWMRQIYGNPGKASFSWVYTFSVMFSSLRNWANHDRYRLRPSTRAELCWSSNGPQPL